MIILRAKIETLLQAYRSLYIIVNTLCHLDSFYIGCRGFETYFKPCMIYSLLNFGEITQYNMICGA